MGSVSISVANLRDAHALSALARATFCETFNHYDPVALADFLDQHCAPDGVTILLAHIGQELVGYAKYGTSRLPKSSSFAPEFELHQLYVLKKWHGHRVGSQLIESVMASGREQGAQTMCLGVWEHNARAQRFYRNYGFSKVGEYDYLPIGEVIDHEWIMAKSLVEA